MTNTSDDSHDEGCLDYELICENHGQLKDKISDLNQEIDDLKHELEGARNTISRLSAEIHRLRVRYRIAAEGDR